jgi:hypothetical protein
VISKVVSEDCVQKQGKGCPNEWFLSPVCGKHVTGNREILEEYEDFRGKLVQVAPGKAVGKGSVWVRPVGGDFDELVIKEVYHKPGLKRNIISAKEVQRKGMVVKYPEAGFQCVVESGGQCVLKGEKEGKLFRLGCRTKPPRLKDKVTRPD